MIGTLFAHRGFHDKPQIPENSMAAFRRAIEHGFGCELDVHLTIDKELVIIHDSDLYRTTGTEGIIENFSLSYLKQLRLEGTDEQIPTLRELLDLFESTPGPDGKICPLIIEIKTFEGNQRELTQAVCRMLDSYSGPFCVESFDPFAVLEVKRFRPDFIRGQLVRKFTTADSEFSGPICFMLRNMVFNPLTQPDFIAYYYKDRMMPSLRKLISNYYKSGHHKHIDQVVWTLKTQEGCTAALDAGCAVIFEGFTPEA